MTICHHTSGVPKYSDLDDFFRKTGKTHEWLADLIGVDKSYISFIRSGQRQPSLAVAIDIEKYTGVRVESLVKEIAS